MRLRHVLGPLSVGAIGLHLVAACLVSQDPPYLEDGGSFGACKGNVAREIPTEQCPGCAGEDGGKAYLQCVGSTYGACACQLTCGYTLLSSDGTPAEGGPRGQTVTNLEPQPCACSGQIAQEMPGSACFGCTGKVAYALCDDTGSFECSCACELPSGYNVLDGGTAALLCDAGAD
jgi:hypothetical protein